MIILEQDPRVGKEGCVCGFEGGGLGEELVFTPKGAGDRANLAWMQRLAVVAEPVKGKCTICLQQQIGISPFAKA